ncbi:hypothetical protein N0V86_008686 [Didymella sp. IMI 355093]|nr:hypothetical protein N0V86_008686 [Didymella sp. IMI 355093]
MDASQEGWYIFAHRTPEAQESTLRACSVGVCVRTLQDLGCLDDLQGAQPEEEQGGTEKGEDGGDGNTGDSAGSEAV